MLEILYVGATVIPTLIDILVCQPRTCSDRASYGQCAVPDDEGKARWNGKSINHLPLRGWDAP